MRDDAAQRARLARVNELGGHVRRLRFLLLSVALLVPLACSGGDDDAAPDEEEEEAPDGGEESSGESWTFLVYMIGDTDLEPFALQDLQEMADVGSTEDVSIVTLADRSADHTDEGTVDQEDWETAKLFQVDTESLVELEDQGEVNMGEADTLAGFVEYGLTEYPADKNALILWDHGAGWPGVGGDESTEDHDVIDLAEITTALDAGMEAAELERFDLIGFDACLMATYEVASTMSPYADYMIASSELEPGHGWDYHSLQVLVDDPSTDAATLGSELIQGFKAQAEEQGTEAEITLSLLDLTQLPALDEAVAELSDALVTESATVAPIVAQQRADVLGFGKNADPAQDFWMADLGQLVEGIQIESLQVSDQADAVLRALGDVVVDKTEGPATLGASGLSIYFPPLEEYANGEYFGVTAAAPWAQFLASFYEAGEAIPEEDQPEFVSGDQAEFFFDEDGFNLTGVLEVAQGNVAEATISYGLVLEDGTLQLIGEEPAEVAEDGSGQVLGIYDLTAFTISDGEDTAYAYLILSFDEETGLATVDTPLAYYEPGSDEYSDVTLSIVYDPEAEEIVQESYYVVQDEAGTVGELTADPEGIVVPQILQILPDGTAEWVPTSDVGLFADLPSLVYDFEPLESGTQLYAEVSVSDFGGNADSISAQAAVP